MALLDLQAFLQQKAQAWNSSLDVSSGSPFDVQVVQPTLRRLGTDPYTVDLATFLHDRIKQAFPEMASDEGDAITDVLIKPVVLLWDPFVREIFRIRNGQSFKDPTILTTDEAEALGANMFSDREKGDFARGSARIFFSTPRDANMTPVNFFTSKGGLHFFPDGSQAIKVDEMLLNVDGGLYYFDVNIIAESPGTTFNIGPNELINVANLEGTAKVTNLRRLSNGQNEESAVTYVGRTGQELTERSMVTLRGIGARVPKAFPEVTRIAVIGFGDPEMQRDVLRGGGLGEILASGSMGTTVLDGKGKPLTSRFQVADTVDFTAVVKAGDASSYVLTVFNAFQGPPFARDLPLSAVLSANTLEVDDQVLLPFASNRAWTLRKRELTLSGIPGGILFPDTAEGTVTIPDDVVHIGGMYDVSVRGASFDEATLVIENLTDAQPAAAGVKLNMGFAVPGEVTLGDLILGTTYAIGDATYVALSQAEQFGFALQIIDGPNAGDYRVLQVLQALGSHPELTLDTAIPVVGGNFRWRLVDVIDVDLVKPRDTRITGTDLQSVQNVKLVTTAGGVDFIALGVGVGDTLAVSDGLDAGVFTVKAVPSFNTIQVDRPFTATSSALNYEIYKSNTAGGLQLPFVRVTKVELLDNTGQPVGSVIPYARPIDIQSSAFENPGRGVKADVTDATLGIVSQPVAGAFAIGSTTLKIEFDSTVTGYPPVTLTFSPGAKTPQQAVDEINSAAAGVLGPSTVLAVLVGTTRIGIVPIDPFTVVRTGSALLELFGDTQPRTSADVRASSLDWATVSPAINQDDLDVVQVLDGTQIGFYGNLSFGLNAPVTDATYTGLFSGSPTIGNYAVFSPEAGRHVQVGSRSIGRVRCYFLEPTSIEFNRDSFFATTLSDGAAIRYFPDPTLNATRIPSPPSTVRPKDGTNPTTTSFHSASQDFVLSSIVRGDLLFVKYQPILGTMTLADPVAGLALRTLLVSVNGGPDQTILFSTDLTGFPNDVSRNGVPSQINSATGLSIAKLGGTNVLELEGDVSIIVRSTGTANSLLGFSTTVDTTNTSPIAGEYVITFVSQNVLTVTPAFPILVSVTRQSYEIQRSGMQRISATQMNANTAAAGLFFFDVELVSEGTGNAYNIDSAQQLFASNYRSDGYYLTTDDENLAFTIVEKPRLHISRSILEVGVADDPRNATQLSGQNIEVTYDRSTLVNDVQNFASSETERVVCANPLSRHLVPHFVRFDLSYVGGSRSDLVLTDVTQYVQNLYPSDLLEAATLSNLAYQRGATSVAMPIDLIAVVYNYDRTVQAQRSQNALNTGRLAAFVPDVVNINRSSG